MTYRERLAAVLPVVRAFLDGKTVQVLSLTTPNVWLDISPDSSPGWFSGSFEFRVKPEPREWWLLVMSDNGEGRGIRVFWSKDLAERFIYLGDREIVHVKEVL